MQWILFRASFDNHGNRVTFGEDPFTNAREIPIIRRKPMQFYTKRHTFYCGIDLHAKKMHVCFLGEKREGRERRNMKTNAEGFLSPT
jgi:hypothetical protein